jgi:transposase
MESCTSSQPIERATRQKDEIEGFEGYLVGDGYSGNKAAARKVKGDIVIAGCWAHTTRKFRDAMEEAPGTALLFRKDIKELYLIEDEATEIDASDGEATEAKVKEARRLALRQEKSRPIVARLLARARKVRDDFSDAGKMGEALGYLLRQRKPLRRFLEHGGLPLDNNACERSIRPIAVGRRNWYFAGSIRGGEAAAVIYTLIECCKLADVHMVDYLADVLERVEDHPHENLDELEPAAWANLFAEQRKENVLKRDAVLSA